MSSPFNDLFEKLLNEGHVEVAVTGRVAEGLRVSLVRRWNQYKNKYDSLGFLPDEKRNLSLSMTTVPGDAAGNVTGNSIGFTRYSLKPRANRASYQILDTGNK